MASEGDEQDHTLFAQHEAKLAEMRRHRDALQVVEDIAEDGLQKLLDVGAPLGKIAINALISGLAQSMQARLEKALR